MVVLNGWQGCPESDTDVLTAHGAGIAWGTVDDALAPPLTPHHPLPAGRQGPQPDSAPPEPRPGRRAGIPASRASRHSTVSDGAMNTSALIPDPTTATRVGAALIGSTALFQVALAAGAPWGAAAWGGQHPGVLPAGLRAASAVGAIALGSLAALAVSPGLLDPPVRRRVLLGATGYFALGTVMNAASRSPVERAIWTPVAGTTTAMLWRATQSAP